MLKTFFHKLSDLYYAVAETLVFKFLVFRWSFFQAPALNRNRPAKPRLLFGTMPIINNKFWAQAMREAGYEAKSVTVYGHFESISDKQDFDVYLNEIFPEKKGRIAEIKRRFRMMHYVAREFDVLTISCIGAVLGDSSYLHQDTHIEKYANREAFLLKRAGCKIVVIPFGGDFYRYSEINNLSIRHAFQVNYPALALRERKVRDRVQYWVEQADVFFSGFQIDGIGRWDLLPFNMIITDTERWRPRGSYSAHDGISGPVVVVHTPNHRGVKGTEFLVKAVEELKEEGILIDFRLIEKMKNTEVHRILTTEADILVEQLIGGAYGMSGVEGMSCGLAVMTNLEVEDYSRIFRRYSYLNECPIVSVTPESIKERLRILILNPALREELGQAARKYAEKYHAHRTAQYMFGKICERAWAKKEVNLIDMFHPLSPESYNNSLPVVEHPLLENQLPGALMNKLRRSV
ncbi:MAG: DedA family protein [Bacteroidetes bacterium]|nr:MAG: DedA family protein [Bacteroidota bacterium]